MKLKADRATLLKALAHVQSVVERRNTCLLYTSPSPRDS